MGCLKQSRPVHAYYAPTGELLEFSYPEHHHAKKELKFVSDNDTTRFNENDDCYVVSTVWHTEWLDFATKQTTVHPGPIDNDRLLDPNNKNIAAKGLKHKKDFRPISKAVWEYLFKLYGGGPVILFKGLFVVFLLKSYLRPYLYLIDLSSERIIRRELLERSMGEKSGTK
jgi:hypothetical protein